MMSMNIIYEEEEQAKNEKGKGERERGGGGGRAQTRDNSVRYSLTSSMVPSEFGPAQTIPGLITKSPRR